MPHHPHDRQQPATPGPREREQAIIALDTWIGRLRLGPGLTSDGLTLTPVYGTEVPPPPHYQLLAAAIGAGGVVVREGASASVPTLVVENATALPILILDGEEVVGGRQNRVVNASLLVPANGTFELPVSCVERGRWSESRPTFDSGETIYPTLRRAKAEQVAASLTATGRIGTDQQAIWSEIAARHRQAGTSSPTGALNDAYAGLGERLQAAERVFPCPDDGPLGVIASFGGRARCADLFDRPATLQAVWRRLVRSYALEALSEPVVRSQPGSAERLLRRPFSARHRVFGSPGLGQDVRLDGNGIVGASLVHAGVPVHTALFRQPADRADEAEQAEHGRIIWRPSQRMQRYL